MKNILWSTVGFGLLCAVAHVGCAESDEKSNDADKLLQEISSKYGLVSQTGENFLELHFKCITMEMTGGSAPYTVFIDCSEKTNGPPSPLTTYANNWETLIYSATTSATEGSSVNNIISFKPDSTETNDCSLWQKIEHTESCPVETKQAPTCDPAFEQCKST
ncbi:uncharacterized protein LOC142591100 isoform X3 [Dermacentor variabilis]|uniref:uncharacterized protein LOC142591100 isoform X3 n=1 Tax=Dermacentor variabilis TaxID=34621 RepID=UPI003F5C7139